MLFPTMADEILDESTTTDDPELPAGPRPKAPPIESRFLYVDVAAMRAKQLRRGAILRLSEDDEQHDPHKPMPHKPERLAMEEVRRGLVLYEVVTPKKPAAEA
jgi:DNA-directed RNA polymerase subunit K/omega